MKCRVCVNFILCYEFAFQPGLHLGTAYLADRTANLALCCVSASQAGLHPGYIPLAEACWARGAEDRPSMALVLQRLLEMLAEVEGLEGSVDWV